MHLSLEKTGDELLECPARRAGERASEPWRPQAASARAAPGPTSGLVHLHAPQLVLPGAELTVHLLVTVVAVLVLLQSLLPQQLHVLHRALVLHDHVVHLLHLRAAHSSERGAALPSPVPEGLGASAQEGTESGARTCPGFPQSLF